VSDFLFSEEVEEVVEESHQGKWKVLIVDDEPEVHAVTRLALSDFEFQGKRLEFVSAYSGKEAEQVVLANPDAAIVLLDVVMETDDAGLKVAEFIREQANNQHIRIILRTGQPGQAPERQVIVNYDINDYKSKTELTAQKLFTVVMSSLRSYRDILAIEQSRQGLEKIIVASRDIFALHSMENFIHGVMQQLTSILGNVDEAFYATSFVAGNRDCDPEDLVVFAGQGEFERSEGKSIKSVLSEQQYLACSKALKDKSILFEDEFLFAYCSSRFNHNSLLYVSGIPKRLSETHKRMIEIFAQNVQIAYENVQLQSEMEDTQRELVYRLSEAVEQRSTETGNHVKRVSLICYELAKLYGLNEKQAETLRYAAPLHDVGKVGIADTILHKASKLDDREWEVMKTHAEKGHKILAGSKRNIIQAGAILAKEHHEKWDGSGYPHGVSGENIHVYGRIVAIADVYDALRHKRCYKEAWPKEQVVAELQAQKGKHFEPKLVDLVVHNIDVFEQILKQYPEQEN
jgi:response regulator RpfG family c-di-GMP phosphodiesterase